eukprot:3543041-Alexandrium_andersonii.AAC.1
MSAHHTPQRSTCQSALQRSGVPGPAAGARGPRRPAKCPAHAPRTWIGARRQRGAAGAPRGSTQAAPPGGEPR